MLSKEVGWEGINRIYLIEDRRRWRAVVIGAMNIQFQTKGNANTPLQVCVKIFLGIFLASKFVQIKMLFSIELCVLRRPPIPPFAPFLLHFR
jgi:hypothetical protein